MPVKRFHFYILTVLVFFNQPTKALTLTEAYKLAVENDPQLAIAKEKYNVGMEIKKSALSKLLPQLSSYATYSSVDKTSKGEFPITLDQDQNPITAEIRALRSADTQTDATQNSWGVRLNQVIFDPALWFSYRGGSLKSKEAQYQFSFDQTDLIFRLIDNYLTVAQKQDQLAIAKSLQDAEKRLYDISNKLEKGGVNTKIDVYRAEAAYDASLSIKLEAETKLHQAKKQLAIILGRPILTVSRFPSKTITFPRAVGDLQQWTEAAKLENLELRIAETRRDAAKEISRSARFEHSFKIAAEASYNDNDNVTHEIDNSLPFDFESQLQENKISITATLPIYSGGGISSNRRKAHHEYLQANESFNAKLIEIEQLTSVAYFQANSGILMVEAQNKAVESSKEALDAITRSYENGASNLAELLQIQKLYFSAVNRLIDIQKMYLLNLARLYLLTNRLTPQYLIDLDNYLEISS